jgi:hypothetical protein
MKYAISFLSRQMNTELLEFIHEMNYKYNNVYCMNDLPKDNNNLIIFNDIDVINAGFQKLNNVSWINKNITAWEKALYYFCKINIEHDYIWFIEDDVFIPHIDFLHEIDAKYPDADLLTKQNFSKDENTTWLGWNRADLKLLDGPYYQSISCAIRVSRKLLTIISNFAKEKGQLVFLEFLFNSLAMQNNLKVETPRELSQIMFEEQYDYSQFNKKYMYHSIKNYKIHPVIRKDILTKKIQPAVLHYLTIATKPHSNLNRIKTVLSKHGDTIAVMGLEINADMSGFGIKLNIIKNYIKNLDNSDIILCTDAYDIIINSTLNEIKKRFISLNINLLFGAEKGCWPDVHKKNMYKTQSYDFPYLNAGGFIGYVGVIKEILNKFNIYEKEDDQRFWTNIYLSSNLITLDHSNIIFFNMFNVDKNKLIIQKNTFKYNNSEPLIYHFNGDTKDYLDTVWSKLNITS